MCSALIVSPATTLSARKFDLRSTPFTLRTRPCQQSAISYFVFIQQQISANINSLFLLHSRVSRLRKRYSRCRKTKWTPTPHPTQTRTILPWYSFIRHPHALCSPNVSNGIPRSGTNKLPCRVGEGSDNIIKHEAKYGRQEWRLSESNSKTGLERVYANETGQQTCGKVKGDWTTGLN